MMEISESQSETRLQMAKDDIANAAENIQAEFERSPNSWVACLSTRLEAVDTFLYSPKVESEL